MRKLILLTASLFCMNCSAQQNDSLKKSIELTYFHKVSFPELFQAGIKHRFVQFCTLAIDSVIEGKLNFNQASIASIKACTLSMLIVADTIRTYEVKTEGEKNTKRLLHEAMNAYGQPTEKKKEGEKEIYCWKKPYGNSQYIVSTLALEAKNKSGSLFSKIE